jgi:ribosomal-protein-alanine N-acetyltransferase
MTRSVAIRAVRAADEEAFISAARRSRKLHAPWTKAPCDRPSFKRYLARFDGNHHHGFVVIHARSGALVGAINLTNIVYGAFRSGYLGYFAFAGHERQGLMKQGLRLVIRHAFQKLGVHRMEANIQPMNVASLALVQSCGFRREGFSPRYLKIGGRWRDHERWALVKGAPLRNPVVKRHA